MGGEPAAGGVAVLAQTAKGDLADARADGGESVLARGREIAGDAELLEQDGLGRDDIGGSTALVEIDEEGDESLHQRGVGVELEMEGAVAQLAADPDLGDAAVDAIGAGPGGLRQGRVAAGAFNHGGETLVAILDQGEVLDELCLPFGYIHRDRIQPWTVVSAPRSFSKRVLSVAFM
jgi:hypothetical protein